MKANKILTKMSAGQVAVGCQLSFPSTRLVELMGLAGLDYVFIDGEHGTFTPESLDDLCCVAELAEVTPIARVPNIEASTILSYLDRGIQGILGPGVDTGEDAQKLVDACYFPPLGKRGLGGAPRAFRYVHMADQQYIEQANSQMLVAAFLEHAEAIDNLDEILSVEGIQAYYVGPQDLSVSLGLVGQPNHPKVIEIDARVRKAAQAVGKKYLSDIIVGDRATNFFLDGIKAFLAKQSDSQ